MERRRFIRNSASALAMGFITPAILQNGNLFANRVSAKLFISLWAFDFGDLVLLLRKEKTSE